MIIDGINLSFFFSLRSRRMNLYRVNSKFVNRFRKIIIVKFSKRRKNMLIRIQFYKKIVS